MSITNTPARDAARPEGTSEMPRAHGNPSRIRLPRILIVEDELVIAQDIAAAFEEIGAEVIGPADSIQSALHLIDGMEIDGALLDVHTRGDLAFSLGDQLRERHIPFAFATGAAGDLPERFRNIPVWLKPFDVALMAREVVRHCDSS